MKIRKIEKNDFADVLTLMRRHAEMESYADIFAVNERGLNPHRSGSKRSSYEILVAKTDDGSVSGYALYMVLEFSFRQRPLLYLNDLMVDEKHHRQGVARALMERLCREAKSLGCFRIKWGVSATNDRAIAFYQAIGATREINKIYFTLDEANFLGGSAPAP